MNIADTGAVFPGYVAPTPLGIVQAAAKAGNAPALPPVANIPLQPSPRHADGWLLQFWHRLLRFLMLGR